MISQKKPFDLPLIWDYAANEGMVPTLSIMQPFATFVADGAKRIEIRTYTTRYRGPILIHAGKRWYNQDGTSAEAENQAWIQAMLTTRSLNMYPLDDDPEGKIYPRGVILGMGYIINSGKFTAESWERRRGDHLSTGEFTPKVCGWEFAKTCFFDQGEICPYTGRLGLFGAPMKILPPTVQSVFREYIAQLAVKQEV